MTPDSRPKSRRCSLGEKQPFETDASYIIDAVSPTEAAEMLGVTRGRVSQMVKAGQLDAHKVGKEVWVDKVSVEKRLTSAPKAGRPRKLSAVS